jgi:hypothetical protein
MANVFIEAVGWIGAALVLSAYFLLTSRKLGGESITYHNMNLLGGMLVAINAIANSAYPSAAINIVWVFVAIYGVVKGTKLFRGIAREKETESVARR